MTDICEPTAKRLLLVAGEGEDRPAAAFLAALEQAGLPVGRTQTPLQYPALLDQVERSAAVIYVASQETLRETWVLVVLSHAIMAGLQVFVYPLEGERVTPDSSHPSPRAGIRTSAALTLPAEPVAATRELRNWLAGP